MMEIRTDDLSCEPVQALLALHLLGMTANSPPGQVFALDLSGLKTPEITVWSVWLDGSLAAIGALKMLGRQAAEIKSMRTHPDHLRKGAANSLLLHILHEARSRGLQQLSLETGSGPGFEAALALYRAHGFKNGPAFAGYVKSDFNQFLHLQLSPDRSSSPLFEGV